MARYRTARASGPFVVWRTLRRTKPVADDPARGSATTRRDEHKQQRSHITTVPRRAIGFSSQLGKTHPSHLVSTACVDARTRRRAASKSDEFRRRNGNIRFCDKPRINLRLSPAHGRPRVWTTA
ncbi:hypothetical protein AZ78_4793 [Lysobacter capsici AZ78]|uniref:Uncharacterized protein n=1 Tax=Lysobacter capsici AZ78 TaxID=1444315 RepID=A0A108UDN0_9GAMM|nr:hypothetical protein AZ78_4793 [Lysobacter capsici AZ78]